MSPSKTSRPSSGPEPPIPSGSLPISISSGSPSSIRAMTAPPRAFSNASRHSNSYSMSRSITSSSHPSRQRRQNSTASGRKSLWGSDSHVVICAIAEARGVAPSVGLSFINITTNEAVLSQICDTQFYVRTIHKLQMYEPSTILMVNTALPPNPKSNLLSIIEVELPATTVEPLDRKYWSENAGLEFIQSLAFRDDLEAIKVAIGGNFYATCSFAAAVKYVELSCRVSIAAHSLRIRYQPSENTMMIDLSTIHSLELIQNLHEPRSKDCLFGLLNQCLTPMGSRMLRSNIIQPSSQIESVLIPRYEALEELTMKEDMFFEIRKALKEFTDVEKLLTSLVIVPQQSSISATESAIDLVLRVKAFVIAVPQLRVALAAARTDLLKRIYGLCGVSVTQLVMNIITDTINDDVIAMKAPIDMRNQRTYAVKSGVYGLLDIARQTYKEATEDVYRHIDELNKEHELAVEVKFDNRRRFWLRLERNEFEDRQLPDVFINKVIRNRWIECQTLILVQLNNRITDSHNEAVMLSEDIIQQVLDDIREHVPELFRVCEGIALLDMVASFAQSATTREYTRPEISGTLALKSARNPICERLNPERFVPNDAYADELHRFQIISGCNMSGKSTYIKMVALMQVMAQIGSFVPAQYAAFPIFQQLFVRLSTDDNIEANMSTFSLEMREMAFILRNINKDSLTIIDELGRGTSSRDGLAIALAISEALIQSGSIVWFATHFQELSRILGSRPGVLNLHLETDVSSPSEDQPQITMLYKIKSGSVQEKNYGIKLAKAMGFPDSFIETAQDVSQTLSDSIERRKAASDSRQLIRQRKVILNLHSMLTQLKESEIDDTAMGSYLRHLQDEFVLQMDSTIEEGNIKGQTEPFSI
ncbi:DNA mismatch repair protein Msh4 [Xylaria bambusicola]|uniref:DNA mismatch repair protein Msh4 n=1 Tax=Xylaria bambusicola TaxID=326684 RepID=UPI0020071E03|nr:DNA mismatch repair protein Msh4 [Xylaria bambusicola]KAI0515221.1 DNA mismatch repair protein Msh4 [Xylaria bambusicola]